FRGASQVTKVGTETVREARTTHYQGTVDLDKAVQASPPQARDAMRKLADLYTVKTLPVDVWLDDHKRVRHNEQTLDASTVKLPPAAQANNPFTGKVTMRYELYDFGAPIDTALPPPDQTADL